MIGDLIQFLTFTGGVTVMGILYVAVRSLIRVTNEIAQGRSDL